MESEEQEKPASPLMERDAQNLAVLTRLLVEGAPLVLRQLLDGVHSPAVLAERLASADRHKTLRRLKVHGVLDPDQWAMLYPPHKKQLTSRKFDAVLLTTLLRYSCSMSPPYPGGWDNEPLDNDHSLTADIVRIGIKRQLLARYEDGCMSTKHYQRHLREISSVMERLAGRKIRSWIDKRAHEPLDEKQYKKYWQQLQSWDRQASRVSMKEAEIEKLRQLRHSTDHDLAQLTNSSISLGRDSTMDTIQEKASRQTSVDTTPSSPTPQQLSRRRSNAFGRRNSKSTLLLSKEEMARLDASIFERFRVQLSETVRSDDVVQRLVQRAMLSHQDKNKINLATTNSQRMNLTINIITAKSAKAFDVFCDVIKFKYKNMHDQLMQAKMEPLINDKPDEATQCGDALRGFYTMTYSKLPVIPWYPDYLTAINDFYIKPQITDFNGRALSPSSLFRPHGKCESPRRVTVQGRSGMGKTALCQYIAHEWARGKLYPGRYKMVFYIDLARVTSGLVDAIIDQCLPNNYRNCYDDLVSLLETHQKDVLFLLDGLDAIVGRDCDVFSLIYKETYRESAVLLTTTPSGQSQSLHKYFDSRIVLLGLTPEGADDLVKVYMRLTQSPLEMFVQIISKLCSEQINSVQTLAMNPLNTMCMCLICEMCGTLEFNTASFMLHNFLLAIAKLYCRQNYIQLRDDQIPDNVAKIFTSFEQFAFQLTLDKKMTFLQSELHRQSYGHDIAQLGLVVPYSGGTNSRPLEKYHFHTRIFQYILAARHLTHMDIDAFVSHKDKMATDKDMNKVAVYFCGLMRFDYNTRSMRELFTTFNVAGKKLWRGATFSDLGQKKKDERFNYRSEGRLNDFVFILDCLAECEGRKDVVPLVEGTFPRRLVMRNKDVPPGSTISGLGQLLATSPDAITELDLRLDHISLFNEQSTLSLGTALSRNTQITTVKIRWTNDEILASFLAKVFMENTSITCLQISDESKNKEDKVSATVWASMRDGCTNMTSVRVFAFMQCANAAMVTSAVRNSPLTLEELHLSGSTIDLVCSQELANKIEKSPSMRLLNLTGCSMARSDFLYITAGLRLNKTISELLLADTDLPLDSMVALAESLKFNKTMKSLSLRGVKLTMQGCRVLGEALAVNQSLLRVQLEGCGITDDGARLLASVKQEKIVVTGLGRASTAAAAGRMLSNKYKDDKLSNLQLHVAA